jgi:hypothetical protein
LHRDFNSCGKAALQAGLLGRCEPKITSESYHSPRGGHKEEAGLAMDVSFDKEREPKLD